MEAVGGEAVAKDADLDGCHVRKRELLWLGIDYQGVAKTTMQLHAILNAS